MRRIAILIALASLAGAPGAQSASYTYLPQPVPSATAPQLTAITLPRLGTAHRVATLGCFGTQYLMLGAGNPSLPTSLGTLYTSAEVMLVFPQTAPQEVSLQIPNDARLIGVSIYQQVLRVCGQSFPFPTTLYFLSRGGHAVIGR